jgi:hypothetical protein
MKKRWEKPVPYVSFDTLMSALDHLKASSLSMPLDQAQCGSLSESTWNQMISSLRFFDLVNENDIPKTLLKTLINAVDRKPLWRKLLKKHYPELFAVDLSRVTLDRFNRLLAGYSISGETLGRARRFFLGAAKYSEVSLSSELLRVTRHRSGRKLHPTTKTRHKNRTNVHIDSGGNQTQPIVLKAMDVELSFPSRVFEELERGEREHFYHLFDELVLLRRRAAARAASQKEPFAEVNSLSQEPSDEAIH